MASRILFLSLFLLGRAPFFLFLFSQATPATVLVVVPGKPKDKTRTNSSSGAQKDTWEVRVSENGLQTLRGWATRKPTKPNPQGKAKPTGTEHAT